jgi:hypothetical protein
MRKSATADLRRAGNDSIRRSSCGFARPVWPLDALEHVPEKWTRFSDEDMLQVFELARILFDQVIPPDRKAR